MRKTAVETMIGIKTIITTERLLMIEFMEKKLENTQNNLIPVHKENY